MGCFKRVCTLAGCPLFISHQILTRTVLISSTTYTVAWAGSGDALRAKMEREIANREGGGGGGGGGGERDPTLTR